MSGFSLLPREDTYFVLFSQMTEKIRLAADALVKMTHEEISNFESCSKKIKDIEHACDSITHDITTRLNKSFITPFDREDIYQLSSALDDITDYIDATSRAIVMYDLTEINEYIRGLASVIQELSVVLHDVVGFLKKPDGASKYIVQIHSLENKADDLYFHAIAELFREEKDPIKLIKYKEIYELLEYTTDRCESVANIVESIFLKHS
jgi:hypothetical protein